MLLELSARLFPFCRFALVNQPLNAAVREAVRVAGRGWGCWGHTALFIEFRPVFIDLGPLSPLSL